MPGRSAGTAQSAGGADAVTGAVVEAEEANRFATFAVPAGCMFPLMLMVMLPLFVFMPILQSPGSSFARWFSLFPPATPSLLLPRISISPGPPWWEIALGVVLTSLCVFACVWAGAKVFRIGLLAQGQAPSFGKLFAWILSK